MKRELEIQRDVTRIALAGRTGTQDGFALAGSGAIREHGLIDRPTQDVDLFTTLEHLDRVDLAAARVAEDLQAAGYEVRTTRLSEEFARLNVLSTDGYQTEVDFGIDWRQGDPIILDVGPVLGLADAVASKTIAVYSRAEVRDFLDLDDIRRSGKFSDEDLLNNAAQRDLGFERPMFAIQLQQASRITADEVKDYGISAENLGAMQERFGSWARQLQEPETLGTPQPKHAAADSLSALNQAVDRRQSLLNSETRGEPRRLTNSEPTHIEPRGRHL